MDRNLKLMETKYPDIPADGVVDIIPKMKVIFTPLVLLPSEIENGKTKIDNEM